MVIVIIMMIISVMVIVVILGVSITIIIMKNMTCCRCFLFFAIVITTEIIIMNSLVTCCYCYCYGPPQCSWALVLGSSQRFGASIRYANRSWVAPNLAQAVCSVRRTGVEFAGVLCHNRNKEPPIPDSNHQGPFMRHSQESFV